MEVISQTDSAKPAARAKRRRWLMLTAILLVALLASAWIWRNQSGAANPRNTGAVQVMSAVVTQRDVPVKLTASGTVSAQQMVEVRPQISATVKAVHIREVQFVRKGDRLFTLDARTEDANLSRTEAQLAKARTDLVNAERNLE